MTTTLIISITVICVVAIICYTILKSTTVASKSELDKYMKESKEKINRIEWEMTSVKGSIQYLAGQIEKLLLETKKKE